MSVGAFYDLAKKLANIVAKWDDIVVVGHYDADGVTSTAILVSALKNAGKNVDFFNIKQLYSDELEKFQNAGEYIIFADMGAGQLPLLCDSLEKPFLILDHHRIPSHGSYPLLLHPSPFGIDGSREISGAGVSYVFAKALGAPPDLSTLAIVGAVGDIQIVNSSLIGYNRKILADAISAGKIFAHRDLALYGRASRPLPYMFVFSSDPVLPGLTANESAVHDFLSKTGIDLFRNGEWVRYVDLNEDEKRRLFTELAIYLSKRGWPESRILSLIGEVYDITSEDLHSPLREVREFATLLNACGRHGHPEVGVMVAMGDRGSWLERALRLLSKHREMLRKGIEWVAENGVERFPNFYFFNAEDAIPASLVGVVAGMVYGSGIVPPDKPVIAMAYDGDTYVKVSARANSSLVRQGVDLAKALRIAAEAVGGEAGGHKPAAGARINRGDEGTFLRSLEAQLT